MFCNCYLGLLSLWLLYFEKPSLLNQTGIFASIKLN